MVWSYIDNLYIRAILIPSNYPNLPQLVVMTGIQDKQAGSNNGKDVETHLHQVASVVEEGHTCEHDEEFQHHANQEDYRHTSQTKV